jgi:hypothetical protein
MENDVKCWCQHCGTELPPSHTGPCPKCGKSGKRCEVKMVTSIGISSRVNLRARNKEKGFKKYKKQIEQGQYVSGDPNLKKGVNLERVIDKGKDEYHEVIKNAETGEIIHEVHEPLSQHKHINK